MEALNRSRRIQRRKMLNHLCTQIILLNITIKTLYLLSCLHLYLTQSQHQQYVNDRK